MKKKKIDKIIVVLGVIEIAESILSWISFIGHGSILCVLIFLLQQMIFEGLQGLFSLAESILYFSYSVKKKKNHTFSDFLGRFLLNIEDCLL